MEMKTNELISIVESLPVDIKTIIIAIMQLNREPGYWKKRLK